MHISTELLIRRIRMGSSCTKINVLAITETTASSLALPWIEITATGLAKTKEPIEFHYFRSEARVYNYFDRIVRSLK